MNGTANFLLSRTGRGLELRAMRWRKAQELGFAEADPAADVDGHDAADKLSILVREAFGVACRRAGSSSSRCATWRPGTRRAALAKRRGAEAGRPAAGFGKDGSGQGRDRGSESRLPAGRIRWPRSAGRGEQLPRHRPRRRCARVSARARDAGRPRPRFRRRDGRAAGAGLGRRRGALGANARHAPIELRASMRRWSALEMHADSSRKRAPRKHRQCRVGFDDARPGLRRAHDRVTAVREARPGRAPGEVTGLVQLAPDESPGEHRACGGAGIARCRWCADSGCGWTSTRACRLSAGMGGSAASAVAAAAAVNALLPRAASRSTSCSPSRSRASASPPIRRHWDNVVASPVRRPGAWRAREEPVLIRAAAGAGRRRRPSCSIRRHRSRPEWRARFLRDGCRCGSRSSIAGALAAFVAGCATGDLELVRAGLEDVLVEPQRAHLLPALRRREGGGARAPARSAAPSRAPGRRSSPGRWTAAPMRSRRRWPARSRERASRRRAYRAPVDSAGRPGVRRRRRARRRMKFVSTRGNRRADEFERGDCAVAPRPTAAFTCPKRCLRRARRARFRTFSGRFRARTVLSALLRRRPARRPSCAAICAEAFDFPAPIVSPSGGPALRSLELFHGPTGAFKDFGARFLMACFDRLGRRPAAQRFSSQPRATPAARSAARLKGGPGVRGDHPLSERPRLAVPGSGSSPAGATLVEAIEVDGDFDDCQRLVKAAFADPAGGVTRLTSANSINIGRLLPQMAYRAWAAAQVQRRQR